MPGPACIEDCATHRRLCELDAGHGGDHECPDCPAFKARQRTAQIADRVAAHRIHDLLDTIPDED